MKGNVLNRSRLAGQRDKKVSRRGLTANSVVMTVQRGGGPTERLDVFF